MRLNCLIVFILGLNLLTRAQSKNYQFAQALSIKLIQPSKFENADAPELEYTGEIRFENNNIFGVSGAVGFGYFDLKPIKRDLGETIARIFLPYAYGVLSSHYARKIDLSNKLLLEPRLGMGVLFASQASFFTANGQADLFYNFIILTIGGFWG